MRLKDGDSVISMGLVKKEPKEAEPEDIEKKPADKESK